MIYYVGLKTGEGNEKKNTKYYLGIYINITI